MREPHLFEFVSSIRIPDNDRDLLINEDYRYVRLYHHKSVTNYIYCLYNRHTWYAVHNIPDDAYPIIETHYQYLKLKYG
jgi:hypothetical protein